LASDASQRAVGVDARKYSLLGLAVFLTDKFVCIIINITRSHGIVFAGIDVFSLTTVIFNWMIPILILYRIESRGHHPEFYISHLPQHVPVKVMMTGEITWSASIMPD